MTAIPRSAVAAILLRAGSVAGVLAIIAGIFAMHVMTSDHTVHTHTAAQAAVAVAHGDTEADATDTDGHRGHPNATHHDVQGTTAAAAVPEVPEAIVSAPPTSSSCSAECPGVQAMSAACVPSAKTGTLTAPEPPQGAPGLDNAAVLHRGLTVSSAYVPASPSPGELSISRT